VKRIAILGSTGSIGQSALAVIDAHADRLQVVALAAGENVDLLAAQIARYRPRVAAMATGDALDRLRETQATGETAIAGCGRDGLVAVASHPDVDLVLCASSGTEALEAVLAAIELGRTIALANKEILVMAGGIVTEAAARKDVAILPVDSEHNAIHQCLHGRKEGELRRLILTASGGPFRGRSRAELENVTVEAALKHPTWAMGGKITIDSATLMNKGLEVIEAHHLFGTPYDAIDVVVHPQSIVHALVTLCDGAALAHLGNPDMRVPIAYALRHPDRVDVPVPVLDLTEIGSLTFEPPDEDAFPCLAIARKAAEAGGTGPCVLNAANEVAVHAFLGGRLPFMGIPAVIDATLERVGAATVHGFDSLYQADAEARTVAGELVAVHA
jgi:1-deoxy-D-xylulose-5-phosphate reductoisomerase